MFRSAILVIWGHRITAFVSFFVVVSYPCFPRGEYTIHQDFHPLGQNASLDHEREDGGRGQAERSPGQIRRSSWPITRAGSTS